MKPQTNVIKLHMYQLMFYMPPIIQLYIFLELNSGFAQFYINIQDIPQLWPFTHIVPAFCVVLVNLILKLLLLLRVL